MIALDTNVVLRFLTQDDPIQSPQATALFSGLTADGPAYLCREVLIEVVWVLERAYGFSRSEIAAAIEGLLAARELVVEASERIALAIERYRQGGAGFSDKMISLAARDANCPEIYSFDRKAVTQAGMTAVPAVI
jgi:predicted nucleic-acid-binding protein